MIAGYRLPSNTRRICQMLKWSTLFIAGVLAYLYAAHGGADRISSYYWNELSETEQASVIVSDGKTHAIRALATLGWFTPLIMLLGAWRIFAAFELGDVFSLHAVKSIRFMGAAILVETITRILFPTLMLALMTHDSPNGQGVLSLSIGTHHLIALLLGALFLIIGQIFTQAVRISDENRQIV